MACVAKEEAGREFPQVPIEVLDSKTAANGKGLIVSAAARAATDLVKSQLIFHNHLAK